MNPYISIWTNPRPTIDYIISRRWSVGAQFFPFALTGINGIATGDYLALLPIDNFLTSMIFIVVLGAFIGALGSLIWTRIVFLSGQTLKGKASVRSIEKVFALAFIPEILITIHWVSMAILNKDHTIQPNLNSPLYFIANILSWRILVIGLARTHKFSHGTAIVSIFLPYLTLVAIVATIKGLL